MICNFFSTRFPEREREREREREKRKARLKGSIIVF